MPELPSPALVGFSCTCCGKCCHGLKLPLTVTEAIAWLSDGHDVQILCDAAPRSAEPAAAGSRAEHRRRRSFEAMSGALPVQVTVILAASFAGGCPNLTADNRCGIYERRPLVCRIYPAEISPFIALQPAEKACPPEAWGADRPVLMRGGVLVDEAVHALVRQSRETDVKEVPMKRALCAALGLDAAALADEGFVIHAPPPAALLRALTDIVKGADRDESTSWRFVSNRSATVDALRRDGASSTLARADGSAGYEYLGLRMPDDA